MSSLGQDFRYGVRMLFKNRSTTAIAVAALALGIGANTAIFSVVNTVLLAPLPYHEPDRLVTLLNRGTGPASPADFIDWRAQARSFERMGAAEGWFANLTGRERPEQILGLHLSEDTFALLGVAPLMGRTLLPEDFRPGREQVVVLSHRIWQRRFNADPGMLGQKLLLDGEAHTVIGVMPPKFRFTPFWITQAEMWAPLTLANRAADRDGHSLRPFARLKPGVSREQAQAEMDTICRRLAQAYPDSDAGIALKVESMQEKVVGDVKPALLIVLGAVGFVLLIACANVANLQLARAAARQREIAIRAALGAGRLRIARQLLSESMVLACVGGLLGVVLAFWGIDSLRTFIETGGNDFRMKIPRGNDIALSVPVLAFSIVLSLATGVLFGLFPALGCSKNDLNESLKEGGRSATVGVRRNRLRGALVIAEVAIALVLMIGAGLMIRSFARLQAIDPGLNPKNLLTLTVSLAGQPQYTGARREAIYREIVNQVQSIPGVQSASMINHLPLGGDQWGTGFSIEGRPLHRPGEQASAVFRVVRPGYFAAMQIPLLGGRDFTEHDTLNSPAVVIVNERLARAYWPNENAIGKRMTYDDPRRNPHWMTVAGIIKDVKQGEWAAKPDNEYYVPFLQDKNFLESAHPWRAYMTLVIRTSADPASLSKAVQNTVWSIDKNLPLSHVQTMEQVIGGSTWQPRFNLLLITLFAALALILSAVGIYGVMSYSVEQRTHEIGIRMALGAKRADVLRMVVGQGMALAAIGGAIGLGGAFALTRLLTGLLYEVKATDPAIFAGVPCLFAAIAFLASYIPALRATKVDPMLALRWE